MSSREKTTTKSTVIQAGLDEVIMREATEPPRTPTPHQKYLAALNSFLVDIECTHEMVNEVLPLLKRRDDERRGEARKFTISLVSLLNGVSKGRKLTRHSAKQLSAAVSEGRSIKSSVLRLNRANVMFRANIVSGMVTRWEEYFGEMLELIHEAYPGRLKNASRTLSYEDADGFDSPGSLRSWFVRQAVEDIVSEVRNVQMERFEKLVGQDLTARLPCWTELMEMGERRHLFVHGRGRIDRKYLQRCKKMGAPAPPDAKIGNPIGVSDEYLSRCREVMFDTGLRLGQLSFRSLFPKHLDLADDELNNIGLTYLRDQEWGVADRIFEFAMLLESGTVSSMYMALVYRVNRCIALKALGRAAELEEILGGTDVSGAQEKFDLAIAVLRENWKRAEDLMVRCARNRQVGRDELMDWPVFWEFRQREEFARGFKRAFRQDFATVQARALRGTAKS